MAPQCNHTLTTSMYAHGDKSLIEMGAKKFHSLIIMLSYSCSFVPSPPISFPPLTNV